MSMRPLHISSCLCSFAALSRAAAIIASSFSFSSSARECQLAFLRGRGGNPAGSMTDGFSWGGGPHVCSRPGVDADPAAPAAVRVQCSTISRSSRACSRIFAGGFARVSTTATRSATPSAEAAGGGFAEAGDTTENRRGQRWRRDRTKRTGCLARRSVLRPRECNHQAHVGAARPRSRRRAATHSGSVDLGDGCSPQDKARTAAAHRAGTSSSASHLTTSLRATYGSGSVPACGSGRQAAYCRRQGGSPTRARRVPPRARCRSSRVPAQRGGAGGAAAHA